MAAWDSIERSTKHLLAVASNVDLTTLTLYDAFNTDGYFLPHCTITCTGVVGSAGALALVATTIDGGNVSTISGTGSTISADGTYEVPLDDEINIGRFLGVIYSETSVTAGTGEIRLYMRRG